MTQSKATHCPILYDAGGLLIVNKPDGVLSHPNPGGKASRSGCKCAFEGPYDFENRRFATPEGPVWLIHRLDQDTSGVLVAARNERAAKICRENFEEGRVRKYYLALAAGKVSPGNGEWRDFISTEKDSGRVRSRVLPGRPPNAKLRYAVRNYYANRGFAFLRIELLTGKTHQIRVQAAARKSPIAGDDVYGNFALNRELRKAAGLKRLFLHAAELEIENPETREMLRIKAYLPEALEAILKNLKALS